MYASPWGAKFKMSCDSQRLLNCKSPREIQGLFLYFKSSTGEESLVFRCTTLGDQECSSGSGFSYKIRSPRHVKIILPMNFQNKSGEFRCLMRGVNANDVYRCKLSPENERQVGISNLNTTFDLSLTIGNDSPGNAAEGTSTAVIAGSVVGTFAFIAIALTIYYLLFRKRPKWCTKYQMKDCNSRVNETLCSWCVPDKCEGNGVDSQPAFVADRNESQHQLLSSSSINEKKKDKEVLNLEENKEKLMAVKINMEDDMDMLKEK